MDFTVKQIMINVKIIVNNNISNVNVLEGPC